MTVKRGGLGRNLSALLGTTANTPLTAPFQSTIEPHKLALTCIQPGKYQPRGEFDDALLAELAASIKQQGLLQPIIVRELSQTGSYEILAGERRWRACQLAELIEIPVIIKQVDDQTAMAIALVENLQREDLNAMDQARAMHRLTSEFGLTHQQIADLLNKSRTAVSNFLRLLTLSPTVRRLLENADLDMGHARALLMLDEHQQVEVAQLVVAKELSVRETEKLVNRIKKGVIVEKNVSAPLVNISYTNHIQNLSERLQTKIALKPAKNGKGTLVIHYESDQNLERVLELLQVETV
jgi:ParB family chromosome partitioning protein